MRVTINGKTFEFADQLTLAQAMEAASTPTNGVATAVNGAVIPADKRGDMQLTDGDTILVIKPFYGG